jgi:hypothetical protein
MPMPSQEFFADQVRFAAFSLNSLEAGGEIFPWRLHALRRWDMINTSGAYWLRLVVRSAGGMSRMVRWPRKKPDQKK